MFRYRIKLDKNQKTGYLFSIGINSLFYRIENDFRIYYYSR
jgi:hypothetical protein